MSFQQQKSRDMEKPGLGYGHCTAQMDVKPFSIRHYVLMSRQKNIAQSWPFPHKYLKLCLNHGISNFLPPLETPSFSADGLHGRSIIDFSLKDKETGDFGKTYGIAMDETEKLSKPGEDSLLEGTISLLCRNLGRLSLGHEQPLATKVDARALGNQSFKPQNTVHKNTSNKGRRRKARTKKKSLAEIFAVAKHCVLDGHDRIYVSGCSSSASHAQNAAEQRKENLKKLANGPDSKSPEQTEVFPLMKKHQRCDDSVTGIGQFNKRSRTMGMINCRYHDCKLKSWSRKTNSCKTAETEKPGGYERKARETYAPVSAID